MRFVIYGIFLVLWMGMWVWTYTCHIKAACCHADALHSDTEVVPIPEAMLVAESKFLIASNCPNEVLIVGQELIFRDPRCKISIH